MVRTRRALALATAALVPMLAIVLLLGHAHKAAGAKTASKVSAPATPSAAEFAAEFVGVTNLHAHERRETARIGSAHCVQAAPGRYMCSYTVTRVATSTCHLMQARWTPDRASTFTVTLAGRTRRCSTLGEALRTLD